MSALRGLVRAGMAGATGWMQGQEEGEALKRKLAAEALAKQAEERRAAMERAEAEFGGFQFGDAGAVSYDPLNSPKARAESVLAEQRRQAELEDYERKRALDLRYSQSVASAQQARGRQGAQGGVSRGTGGAQGAAPRVGRPNEYNQKAAFMLPGAVTAVKELDRWTHEPPSSFKSALDALPNALGNRFKSEDEQILDQARATLTDAVLRLTTGATINDSEIQNLVAQAIPEPGDKPAKLALKAQRRQQLLAAIAAASESAMDPEQRANLIRQAAGLPSAQMAPTAMQNAGGGGQDRQALIRTLAGQGYSREQIKAKLREIDAGGQP